ncbi:MAG: ABC transporter ATP-binding protein [Candidatus Dormibacteraeota bacterium]|nr:ABC transporter ATP-binding protein [Candidatus Dormibacteraeota bacterium]
MNAVIELTGVTKRYSGIDKPALDNVSLTIDAGEFTAIMGPSGSGKSTLLNLIAAMDKPDSGQVVVDSMDVGAMSEAQAARFRRESLGFIFQFFHLLPTLSVLDNVLIPARLERGASHDARGRATTLLAELGLESRAGSLPSKLSGGQQQRAAVARALINRPRLLLADEPTGALDSDSGEQVMMLLQRLHQDGQTIVLVTHDAKLATRFAGRVVSLIDGRIADDTPLFADATAQTAQLVRVAGKDVALAAGDR